MTSETILVGTDIAQLMIFHPEDLAHRRSAPVGWQGYDFALRPESAAGNLVVWSTGFDGGFRLRLTTEGLTPLEASAAGKPWRFPLRVRHGRVLVEGGEALPSEEAGEPPSEEDADWFNLPGGDYLVTVHPVEADPQPDQPPHYVVVFEAVENLEGIAPLNAPPLLRPFREAEPFEPRSAADPRRFLWFSEPEGRRDLSPALILTPEARILPGRMGQAALSEEVFQKLKAGFEAAREARDESESFVAAAELAPGALAVACHVRGWSRSRGEAGRISFEGRRLARILALEPGEEGGPPLARVASVEKPGEEGSAEEAARLRGILLEAARDPQGKLRAQAPWVTDFDLEWLATLETPESVSGWALEHLSLPLPQRLALYAAPFSLRARALEAMAQP